MGLKVDLDTRSMSRWAEELSARGLRNAIRRAVDQSARAARKEAIPAIAKDIGVARGKIREATPKVQTTTASNLSAHWTVSKMRIGIINVQGAKVGRGGLRASTHRLTGGGSASLNIPRAFLVKKGGQQYVAYRSGAHRLPIKAVYAEHPATALGQTGGYAQRTWQKVAEREANRRLETEIQKQLVNEGIPYQAPNNPDE